MTGEEAAGRLVLLGQIFALCLWSQDSRGCMAGFSSCMRVHDWRLLTAGGWLVAVALVEASFMYLLAGHWQQLYGELSGMHDRLQEAAGAGW